MLPTSFFLSHIFLLQKQRHHHKAFYFTTKKQGSLAIGREKDPQALSSGCGGRAFHFQASTPIWVFKLLDLYSFPYAFDTYAFEAIETFIL
jgi:hypothetical protein